MTKLAKECAQKSWLQVRNYALKGKGYVPFPSAPPLLQPDIPLGSRHSGLPSGTRRKRATPEGQRRLERSGHTEVPSLP